MANPNTTGTPRGRPTGRMAWHAHIEVRLTGYEMQEIWPGRTIPADTHFTQVQHNFDLTLMLPEGYDESVLERVLEEASEQARTKLWGEDFDA